MEKLEILTRSRVNVIGILAGALVTIVSLFFWMSLTAAAGMWTMRYDELPMMGLNFLVVASIAWVISAAFGGFVSALIARSKTKLDGFLQSFLSWASAYWLFGGMASAINDLNVGAIVFPNNQILIRTGFFADVMSLVATVLLGLFAVYLQTRPVREKAPEKSFAYPVGSPDMMSGGLTHT